jgi:hypothetical protein
MGKIYLRQTECNTWLMQRLAEGHDIFSVVTKNNLIQENNFVKTTLPKF